MDQKITFAQIAEHTGYSKATISRYFNNPDSLAQKTREIIEKALHDLNYRENKLAQILAKGKSEFIGVIIPNTYMDYYSEILDLILASYPQNHYKFLIFLGNRDQQIEKEYIQELMSYRIQGLISLSHTLPSQTLRELKLPIVVFERESEYVSGVHVNNYKGGKIAADHLIEKGSEILIHINSKVKRENSTYGRIEGFKQVCQLHGIEPQFYFGHFGSSAQSARAQMKEFFEQIERNYPKDKVKGIFFSNDTYASIFLNLLVQKYKCLPDTYRLIGFDNTRASSEAIYPITTVAQPKEEMVAKTLELLQSQIGQKENYICDPVQIQCEPYLIERQTT